MERPSSLPPQFRLLDNEAPLASVSHEPRRPPGQLSSLRELYRLTRASHYSDIGKYGPAIAALALEGTVSSEHQGLYDVVFGRDSLRVAIELVNQHPRLARTTIHALAEMQGVTYDDAREEEPGRIAHEIRDPQDPIAQRLTNERGWDWPYYGSVDATPQFVRTLAAYCQAVDHQGLFLSTAYTDRSGETKSIAGALMRAVDWMTSRLDASSLGLLEYKSTIPLGIENQVWKDSWDAYHHADGSIANHDQSIAALEVQTVTHDALRDAAHIYETVLDRKTEAAHLRERARQLATTILARFWTEDRGGYFVLGLDRDEIGNYRQMKIRTSNMGHVLNSDVLEGEDAERIHKRATTLSQLSSPELLTVGGIRTLASDELRYREGAYHNGSVWIWDTHHIANGARRYPEPAFQEFASDLDRRILHTVNVVGGFPEYVRGGDTIAVNTHTIDVMDTLHNRVNRVEQPPQEVQAWTVAAVLATKYRNGRRLIQG